MKTLALFALVILLSGCGLPLIDSDGGKKSSSSSSELYSYDFTENGCKTGKHTASSKSELQFPQGYLSWKRPPSHPFLLLL